MSRDTLAYLAELRTILAKEDRETTDRMWYLVEAIEGSLEFDPRYSKQERALVAQLRSGVSDVIVAHRDGLNPYSGSAGVAISALESSLKRRTTGEDGWPLA